MSERLARSAGLIGLATFSSRILGLVRDSLVAAVFGAGGVVDAFYVATRVPNLLRDLFAEGAMSAAFVPTFTKTLTTDGRAAAWRLGSLVLNTLLLVTGALVLAGILFAEPFIGVFAREYGDTPGKLELTTSMTRIAMPFLTMVAVAAALMGMLNSLRRFFVPAFSPATFNVVMIACVIGLAPVLSRLGYPPIYALAMGTVLGGLAQIATQVPVLWREGYRHTWTLDFSDPGLRRVMLLMGPGTLGLAATQVNQFVNTYLATNQDGWVSWLTYSFRLMYLPIGVLGVSIATAAIPDLARHAALGATRDMRTTLSSALRLMLVLGIPACVGLIALAGPIVELVFERGEFLAADTTAVAMALTFYAPGLIGYSVVKLASPSFYALGDARTPVLVSLGSIVSNLTLNLILVRILGFRGLALGTAIAASLNAALLLWLLSRRLDGLDARRVATTTLKIGIASVAMWFAAQFAEAGVRGLLPPAATLSGWVAPLGVRLLRVAAGIGAGIGMLALASHLLRIAEFRQAMKRVMARLRPAPRG